MEQLMDLKQASEALRLSIYTLRAWVYAKKIPHVRLGRRVLLKRADLEAMVDKNRIPAREK